MIADFKRDVVTRPRALVLFDPKGAFASVAARPLSGLAFAVVLAFALLPPLTFVARVDLAQVVEKEIKRSGKADQIPAEAREQAITTGAKVTKVLLPAGALMKRSMWMALVAALSFAALKGSRPDLKIEPLLGAAAVAMAPMCLHDVFVAATFLAKDPLSLPDAQNAVLSNPAAWLALDSGHSLAGAALKGLDFFELWTCALLGIGMNVVAQARSPIPYAISFGGQALATVLASVGAAFASAAQSAS